MPYVDGVETDPKDAAAAGRCPECGRDMTGSTAAAEIAKHWPGVPRPTTENRDALERIAMINDFFAKPAPKPGDKPAADSTKGSK